MSDPSQTGWIVLSIFLIKGREQIQVLAGSLLEATVTGYDVVAVTTPSDTAAHDKGTRFDVYLFDTSFSCLTQTELFQQVASLYPGNSMVFLPGFGEGTNVVSRTGTPADMRPFDLPRLEDMLAALLKDDIRLRISQFA